MIGRLARLCFVASMVAMLWPGTACPQGVFPTKPVKFLVPYPAGGTNDVLARIVSDKLQAKWGQPIVIENRTGAGGNIAAALAWQAEPDGYTLLASATPPLAINQSLYKHLAYNAPDSAPITFFAPVPIPVFAPKSFPHI